MPEGKIKIVNFEKYCAKCKHKDKAETEDPCWDCLTNPSNIDTRKPINYDGPKLDS